MSFASLRDSPLRPGVTPVEIYYREAGQGLPLVLLHGGWGHSLNPFDRQIEDLRSGFRVLCPDRSGYGRSPRLNSDLPSNFHYLAATETVSFMDAQGIERAFLWGHSDGAVIAAIIGFTAPQRVRGLILEAFHYYRMKPRSREFFEIIAYQPETLGADLREKFAREFGRENWRNFITNHAKAWLQLATSSVNPGQDLYDGRLNEISAPTLFVHGHLDPRTEPGEIDAAARQVNRAEIQIIDGAGHSPHSESAFADKVTMIAREFLANTFQPSALRSLEPN